MSDHEYDLVVVGAGPAGSSAAYGAAINAADEPAAPAPTTTASYSCSDNHSILYAYHFIFIGDYS